MLGEFKALRAEMNGKFTVLYWMFGSIVTILIPAVVVPFISSLFGGG